MSVDYSKLRDRAWPEVSKSVWGEERHAVRDYMKKTWKGDQRTEEVQQLQLRDDATRLRAAKEEASQILEWWRTTRYPERQPPESNSREFANWLLRAYHDYVHEAEKVNPFDHKMIQLTDKLLPLLRNTSHQKKLEGPPMAEELRDLVWPFIELWGDDYEAVRGHLRGTWEKNTAPSGYMEATVDNARIEMKNILGWWWNRYGFQGTMDLSNRPFGQRLLQEYREQTGRVSYGENRQTGRNT